MAEILDVRLIHEDIQRFADRIKSRGFKVWRMYLFGSYAKGRQTKDSDIDLAVFLDEDDIDGYDEAVEMMHIRRDINIDIEPHAFARTDFDETTPLIREIITTGERII